MVDLNPINQWMALSAWKWLLFGKDIRKALGSVLIWVKLLLLTTLQCTHVGVFNQAIMFFVLETVVIFFLTLHAAQH